MSEPSHPHVAEETLTQAPGGSDADRTKDDGPSDVEMSTPPVPAAEVAEGEDDDDEAEGHGEGQAGPSTATRRSGKKEKKAFHEKMGAEEQLALLRLRRDAPDQTWREIAKTHNAQCWPKGNITRPGDGLRTSFIGLTDNKNKTIHAAITELEREVEKKKSSLMSSVMPKSKIRDWMKPSGV